MIIEDHARVCGENLARYLGIARCTGSPPRVRGKRFISIGGLPFLRITPACAGKTYRGGICYLNPKDHPRVCGENTSEMAYFRG